MYFINFFFTIVLTLLLILLIPLSFLCMIIDGKLSNIFFYQIRIGINGNKLTVIKFKTFKVNNNNFNSDISNDQLNTFGVLFKKFGLDEIPQVINILKGEMSLVGPRCHAIIYENNYLKLLKNSPNSNFHIRNRRKVLPGLIGLSQIYGFRGDSNDDDEQKYLIRWRYKLDSFYVTNNSIGLNLKIILLYLKKLFLNNLK